MTAAILPSKGEVTRARIIDAASTLFLERGFHGTSMRQIVTSAGVTMGGIYNHFSSKEELWKAVLIEKHPYREIIAALERCEAQTVTEFVHAAAVAIVNTLGSRPDVFKLMLIEMVEFGGRDVPLLFEAILPRLGPFLAGLQPLAGHCRPLPPQLMVRAFGGLFFSYHLTSLLLPAAHLPPGDQALDGFVEIFLHGILEPEEVEHHG